jgi:hypothetical protein
MLHQNRDNSGTMSSEVEVNVFIKILHGATAPSGAWPPHYRGFVITIRHAILGSTPLDEWSARRTDLYLTTHKNHKRQTSIPPSGIRTHNPSNRAAVDPRLRLWDHWTPLATSSLVIFGKGLDCTDNLRLNISQFRVPPSLLSHF